MERRSGGLDVHARLHPEDWKPCLQMGSAAAKEGNKSGKDVEPKRTHSRVCRRDSSGSCEDGVSPFSVVSAKRSNKLRDNFVRPEKMSTNNAVRSLSFTANPEEWDEVIVISHSPQVAYITTSSNRQASVVGFSNGTAHAERGEEENIYKSNNNDNNSRNNWSRGGLVSRNNSLDETVVQVEQRAVSSPSGFVVFKRLPPHAESAKVAPSPSIDHGSRKEGSKVSSSSIHRQAVIERSMDEDVNRPLRGSAVSGGYRRSVTGSERASTGPKGLSRRSLLPLRLESIDVTGIRKKSDAIQQWLNEVEREKNRRGVPLNARRPRSPVRNPVEE
ncbi:hypothetical protein TcYC6_0079970 [Trypanosoma cruzi]|nr:hypothetical protein TcYC6_0079970 [Trypanosoma cruzi]